jgi:branched-chain amino acid aminotransferase
MLDISIRLSETLKEKPNPDTLGFGSIFTDHLFKMEYTPDKGWHNPSIEPYGPITMDPSNMVLHYGQETFEGLKAYKNELDEIFLFRPEMNAQRLNQSNRRLCIPEIPEHYFLDGLKALISLEREWIPKGKGTSLYIRPFVFATDPSLMVYPSRTYIFMIILSPVGPYYKEGINPVKIFVETNYVRAAIGGVGFAKTGGNYGGSLLAQENAKEQGYSQVLWLDSKEHRYIEEVGTMNVFFVKGNALFTPKLSGSILPGITRDSIITIARSLGIEVIEGTLDIKDILEAIKRKDITEAFGTGTAAVISPISEFFYKGESYPIGNGKIGCMSQRLYALLSDIQTGQAADEYGFRVTIN